MAKHDNPKRMRLAFVSELRHQRVVNQQANGPARHHRPRPRFPVGTVYVGTRTHGIYRMRDRGLPALRIDA